MKSSNLPSSLCVESTNSALVPIFCAGTFSQLSFLLVYSLSVPGRRAHRRLQIIKGRETGRFTFEALLLLTLLSNFHKSDAAKLNPFLRHIGEITDMEVLRKVCWAAEFAVTATAR